MVYVHTLGKKMGFGKYSDQTLKEVIDNDPSYIDWCLKNVSKFAMDRNATHYYEGQECCPLGGKADEGMDEWADGRSDDYDDWEYGSESYSLYYNPYDDDQLDYDDQLDMDQQSMEFWDSL